MLYNINENYVGGFNINKKVIAQMGVLASPL